MRRKISLDELLSSIELIHFFGLNTYDKMGGKLPISVGSIKNFRKLDTRSNNAIIFKYFEFLIRKGATMAELKELVKGKSKEEILKIALEEKTFKEGVVEKTGLLKRVDNNLAKLIWVTWQNLLSKDSNASITRIKELFPEVSQPTILRICRAKDKYSDIAEWKFEDPDFPKKYKDKKIQRIKDALKKRASEAPAPTSTPVPAQVPDDLIVGNHIVFLIKIKSRGLYIPYDSLRVQMEISLGKGEVISIDKLSLMELIPNKRVKFDLYNMEKDSFYELEDPDSIYNIIRTMIDSRSLDLEERYIEIQKNIRIKTTAIIF